MLATDFERVTAARAIAKTVPLPTVSERTARDYTAKAKRLLRRAKASGGKGVAGALAQAANTKKASTWYANRAALRYTLAHGLHEQLRLQQEMQRRLQADRVPQDDPAWQEWGAIVGKAYTFAMALQRLLATSLATDRARRQSKRTALRGLPVDWRERIIQRLPNYQPAALVAAVTGCRPDELVRGVTVAIEGGELVVTVAGAKTTEATGQPWRLLFWPLDSTSSLVRDLVTAVRAAGGQLVARIDSGKRFHGAVRAAGRREWPRKRDDITPYCFRHQAAADMKADGLDSAEISAALGHLSDVTKTTYGHANMGRAGGVSPARVKAAREVKIQEPSVGAKARQRQIRKAEAEHLTDDRSMQP